LGCRATAVGSFAAVRVRPTTGGGYIGITSLW